jgi:hypothetical protein
VEAARAAAPADGAAGQVPPPVAPGVEAGVKPVAAVPRAARAAAPARVAAEAAAVLPAARAVAVVGRDAAGPVAAAEARAEDPLSC